MNENFEIILHEVNGAMISYNIKNTKDGSIIGWMVNEFGNAEKFNGFDSEDKQIFYKLKLWEVIKFFEKYYVENFK